MQSLAENMFGDVFKGIKGAADKISEKLGGDDDSEPSMSAKEAPPAADAVVADLDARAATGELTFKDFLTLSSAFDKMGGKNIPGMPTLSDSQLAETREKFARHEKIVEVMLDEERDDPQLLVEDLKAGAATPGPRIQRLATASAQPETEVAMFLMQFEAMRESTRRIAAGENPDEVNESLSAPPGSNRKARRAASKKAARVAKKKKM